MRLILFLGAGVSAPSGLPTAAELTDRVFTDPFHDDGAGHFTPGNAPANSPQSEITTRVRALLTLLRAHDVADILRVGIYPTKDGRFKSSGAIYRGASTYEDLFFLCQQITLWNMGLSDNSLTTPFLEHIERRVNGILPGTTLDARLNDLAGLGQLAGFFLESIVAAILQQPYRTGLDVLRDIAQHPRITQLNIVTLNHDTHVEQSLTANNVPFIDGFGPPEGDVRWWNDALYDAPSAHVRLFKLHGSINWYSFARHTGTAIALRDDVHASRDGNGEVLVPSPRRPTFLSGINKSVSYQRGIYGDVHFRFSEVLRQSDRMLICGYGWGDTALNFQLESWLDRSPLRRLILLHPHPEELRDRALIMASSYDSWVRNGKLVLIPHWLCETTLSDLTTHLDAATTE